MLETNIALARTESHTTTMDFREVNHVISDAIQTYGADRVLLALDIDNTTLETIRDIGSEHWFLWQSKLISDNAFDNGAVAHNVSDLLLLQSLIIHQSIMKPVEPRIPLDLQHFGKQGIKMIALTSRGLDMRDATARELSRNGFPYATYAPGPKHGFSRTFKPYELDHIKDFGLTQTDVSAFNLKEASDVSFENGIFLTAGQHKGIMLKTLLAKIRQKFDAIVFIDDRLKHSEGMQSAFANDDVMIRTIQFSHTASKIERFQLSDKKQAKTDWCEFSKGLTAIQGSTPMAPFILCR
jgi:hypothetical protein